jgi:hypothetical protein
MPATILTQPSTQAPLVCERPISGPIAWTGATLDRHDGILTLDAACLDELARAIEVLRSNPLPTLLVEPEAFELDACRALMAEARKQLERGLGFVLIDRLPLDAYDVEEAKALYWVLAQLLARPVAQSWDGKMIYDVRDLGRPPGNGVRPDITNAEQSFHTDNSYNVCPPDYVALLCLHPAMQGGISRIVSFASAHNAMLAQHANLLPRLYHPFLFDRQREHAPGDPMVLEHALFSFDGSQLTGRLSRFQVRNGHALAERALDPEGDAALEALDQIMKTPVLHREFFFERGQIQIIDNRRLGHCRTGFRDCAEPERKRHLVRLWLRNRGRRFYNG